MSQTSDFRSAISGRARRGYALLSLVTVIAGWWIYASTAAETSIFVPSPQAVATAFIGMMGTGFTIDILASTARILGAFAVSALIAIPVGIAMSSFRWFGAGLQPLVEFVRYVPVPALLPLFVLWTGIGESTKFLVLFFGTFFQLVLLIRDDADDVPSEYFELARTLGARRKDLLKDVLLPSLLPKIYDRLRVTLGWCWTYLVIAELIAVERGVGHVLKEAQRFSAADRIFVCFLILGGIGLLTDILAEVGYNLLFPHIPRATRA